MSVPEDFNLSGSTCPVQIATAVAEWFRGEHDRAASPGDKLVALIRQETALLVARTIAKEMAR